MRDPPPPLARDLRNPCRRAAFRVGLWALRGLRTHRVRRHRRQPIRSVMELQQSRRRKRFCGGSERRKQARVPMGGHDLGRLLQFGRYPGWICMGRGRR